ncbi:MAG: FecR domain-containing protein [Tannerellaceae bacterium]|jgi:hypothetical protein|nr:FecR domain-containing protein [Tannerellaceae bacterium]
MMQNEISRKDDGKQYSFDDLFQDDNFIASQLSSEPESEAYWNEMLEKGLIDREDYTFACRFIRSVQVRPEFISDAEIFNLWVDIEVTNKANMKRKKKRYHIISIVSGMIALFALILSVRTIIPDNTSGFSPLFTTDARLEAGTDIQLYLDGNKPVSLGGREAKIAYNKENITINDNDIVLKKELSTDKKQTFHQLVVPWGKRSILTLSEGSRIWVNAGTRVAYPVDFDKKKREIYVDGEIYIEVSPDEQSPFIVKTTEMDVEVLGTAFDITAYEKDNAQRIVLVRGSVKVRTIHQENETILSPNEMYSFSNGISKIQTVKVEDHISWKNGLYHYNSEQLGVIMEHLSHYYGCSIVCSPKVSQMKFSGKLDLKDKLETILDGISQIASITYQYNQGVYIITNK